MALFASSLVFLHGGFILESSLVSIPIIEYGAVNKCYKSLDNSGLEPTI